jgi:uncharacterized protein YacL
LLKLCFSRGFFISLNLSTSTEGIIFVPIKLVLRIIFAIIFATLAIIYSELIPPLEGTPLLLLRALITTLAAMIGFLVFPDIATRITDMSISTFNFMVNRVAGEVFNRLLHLPRGSLHLSMSPTQTLSASKPLILDTSAIIDGRILDIAKTGFLSGQILLPNFVLLELQQVADSSDALKRARGRRGFQIVDELKKVKGLRIEVWDREVGGKAVDEKLLRLAKSLGGKIITTDFNLNTLSKAHEVTVLNVNDLSNAVKTVSIPGEELELLIVHVGKNPKQGVGYLPDGTMIVVEDGVDMLGKIARIEVTRVLQGSAGRMIFSKIKSQ